MTAERDTNRIVRSWLREDEHDSADRVLMTVLARLDTTPQRRPMWPPRRSTLMSNPVRIALAAAAVIVVAVVGLRFLPNQGLGPGTPTTAPTPSATPTAAQTSPPNPPVSGAIEPGTYLVRSYTQTPFKVTVPSGWNVQQGMLATGDFFNERAAVLLRPWIVTHVYADACRWQGSMKPVGPTKAALVTALTEQTTNNSNGPVDVKLGGLDAVRFVLPVPTTFDVSSCNDGYLRPFPGPNADEGLSPPMFAGSITTLYVVETAGKATAIQAARYEGSSAADVAELQAVLDSIVFLP